MAPPITIARSFLRRSTAFLPLQVMTFLQSSLLRCCAVFGAALLFALPAQAQKIVNYGADFLAGGVGGRALGMGGTHVALATDVSAGYWNAAGLGSISYPEVAYMHAERFAGVVSFDYGSVAWPINARSTLGISFFRSGVNDIKNTLDAWDPERDRPKPNPEDHVSSFSAADAAFYLSYARAVQRNLTAGASVKIIRRNIGSFANAWGYSFDVGARYRLGSILLGVNLQDAASMRQSWSVDQGSLGNIEDVFGETLPQGGVEVLLPVARLGSGYVLGIGDNSVTVGFDVDLAFDGQRSYALNTGDVSYHPRMGAEYSYKGIVALRAGVGDITKSERFGWSASPTVGAGLRLNQLNVDYGFGDFAGLASDLGFTHRISARLTLARSAWQRTGE